MRTIKFRGRTSIIPANESHDKIGGHWVHGYLIGGKKGSFYIKEDLKSEGFWVEPESVGQFTGMFDKNGTEIYEGDNLLINNSATAVVAWRNEGFDILDTCSYAPTSKGNIEGFVYARENKLQILGNIHDNPELLGTNSE